MARLEEFVEAVRLGGKLKSQEDNKCCKKTVCWVLGVIGAILVVAGIAYAIYRYLTPDYLEEFDDDDFDDDLDVDLDIDLEEDIFEDESDDFEDEVTKEEPEAEPVVETVEPEVSAEETAE